MQERLLTLQQRWLQDFPAVYFDCRLPLAICHMKKGVNLHEEHEKQISRIYCQISFCWQLLQLKMKDKGEWELYYCTLLSTVECHLPFIKWKRDVFTLNHQKTLLNNIYRRLSFNWRLLQFKIKDKEEWELYSCPLLSTVAVSYVKQSYANLCRLQAQTISLLSRKKDRLV